MAGDFGSSAGDVPVELSRAAPRIQGIRQLGAGGMGAVYLGRDSLLRRSVAVKVLSADLATDVVAHERFMRDAEAAATVNHPNVASVYEVGELPVGTPTSSWSLSMARTRVSCSSATACSATGAQSG